jgi:hypothetical protein
VVAALALSAPAIGASTTARAGGTGSRLLKLSLFADQVETLGAERYQGTFAGVTLESKGVTDLYAVAAYDGNLVRAVRALDKQGYPVKVVGVKRSYRQLNALNVTLTAAYSRLKARGVDLGESWPDPSAGSVEVAVQRPTAAAMSALASAERAPVTSSNYQDEAATLLKRQIGAGFTVQSRYAGSWTATGRINDTPPFYDGDQIFHGDDYCTGGFNMVGNVSGNDFMYTAGHCGDGDWQTAAANIGDTSTNYLSTTSGNDFQSIYLAGGGLPIVWTASGLAPVTGQVLPAVGSAITFDGSVTGEVRGNTIKAINLTVDDIYDPLSGQTYVATYQVQATNPDGYEICEGGDSGGPVYQHTGGTNVLAVGIITASSDNGSECIATEIGHLESVTDTKLIPY